MFTYIVCEAIETVFLDLEIDQNQIDPHSALGHWALAIARPRGFSEPARSLELVVR